MITLYRGEHVCIYMKTITILAVIAILAAFTTTGVIAIGSATAQVPLDNATMAGNVTGGNVTGGNVTDTVGGISGFGRG